MHNITYAGDLGPQTADYTFHAHSEDRTSKSPCPCVHLIIK